MASRRNFYYRQLVTEAELDAAFNALEVADRFIMADMGQFGVLANAVVTQHSPTPNLTVDVSGSGLVYDQLGERIAIPSLQVVDVSVDSPNGTPGSSTAVGVAGNEKWCAVYVRFKRVLSDNRLDGNNPPQAVSFVSDEGFEFCVVQGSEALIGAAVRPTTRPSPDGILLADVQRLNAQTQITNANISTTRREDVFVATGTPQSIRRGRSKDAIADLLGFYNNHVNNAVASDKHQASNITYGQSGAWATGGGSGISSTNVEAALDEIVFDLASTTTSTSGARLLGVEQLTAVQANNNNIVAGSIFAALTALKQASNIEYAGGGSWAAGTSATNPAATVEAQLDKIITDLAATASGASGAHRIGFDNGSIAWADATGITATNVRAALAEVVSDLASAGAGISGAHKVGFDNTSVAWLGGSTISSTTVRAAIAEIVSDLSSQGATPGASLIGFDILSDTPDSIGTTTVKGALSSLLGFVNARVRKTVADTITAGHTYSAAQTMNGASGDTNTVIDTTATPTNRKLLWRFNIDATLKGRFYADNLDDGFTLALGCSWNGTQWVGDSPGASNACVYLFSALAGRITLMRQTNTASAWSNTGWSESFDLNVALNNTTAALGNDGVTGMSGSQTLVVGMEAGGPSPVAPVGAVAQFRAKFQSTPSSLSIDATLVGDLNLTSASLTVGAYNVNGLHVFTSVNTNAVSARTRFVRVITVS